MTDGASIIRWILIVSVATVLQIGLASQVPIAEVHPELLLLVSVCAGLVSGPGTGAGVGFACGLILDLFVPGRLGITALSYVLVGYGAGVALGDVDGDGRVDVFLARTEGCSALYRNTDGQVYLTVDDNFYFRDTTNLTVDGANQRWQLDRDRKQYNLASTYFVDTAKMGTHTFKAGAQIQYLRNYVAAGWLGLVVAELTGPFTGIDFRLTIAVGTILGWLTATGTLPGRGQSPDGATDVAVARR